MELILSLIFLPFTVLTLAAIYASIAANQERLETRITELSKCGANPDGGVTRPGYSSADIEARTYIIELMNHSGLGVFIDTAGNIIGRRPGKRSGLPAISFGSHIDSVPSGGKYDGSLGVIAALECIDLLNEHDIKTDHPVEVIILAAEEDGLFGSKGMTGSLSDQELSYVTNSGKTVRDGINSIGGNTDKLYEAVRKSGELKAFLELHIEQGAVLDVNNLDIGVVEGVVGIEQWIITVHGKANHAGTTPMDLRFDALVTASKIVVAVDEIVKKIPGRQVATTGRLSVEPGASNVVPGKAAISLEIRDLSSEKIQSVFQEIAKRICKIESETKTRIDIEHAVSSKPAMADNHIQQMITDSAKELGLTCRNMPSGAGHDAQLMASIAPMGMIFVPSKGGVSHSPDEYTSPRQMRNGVSVLFHTIIKVDKHNVLCS